MSLSLDNKITNSKVKSGKLPVYQEETTPQRLSVSQQLESIKKQALGIQSQIPTATGYTQRTVNPTLKQFSISNSPTPQVLGASTFQPPAARGDDFANDTTAGYVAGQTVPTTPRTKSQLSSGIFPLAGGGGPSAALKSLSISLAGGTPQSRLVGGISNSPTSNQTSITDPGKRYSRYGKRPEDEDTPVTQEPSYEEIQKQLMREAQKEVNALNRYERSLLQEQNQANQEYLRQNAAVNTLTGLAGSSEANVTTQRVQQQNQQANKQIMDAVNTQVQSVLANVRKDARDMYQYERTESRLDTETARKNREEALTRATTNATLLAASGATAEGYAQTDPEGYQYLAQQVGGEDVLKAIFTLNRPQEQILDKRIEGGKYVIAYQNPLDGKTRIESIDLGLPPQYTKTLDAGDRILAIPDNWSGDPAELITINKGLTPGQQAGADSGATDGAYASDLDAIIGATKATITSKFGQQTFDQQMARARNEGDKINLVASVVLGKADSQTKSDFANQAVGINQIDKAIKLLDQGVQTGVLQAGAQYAYNIVGKDFDPNLAQINQLITSAIQPYRNSVTGAAWGDQEDGEYNMLFGSTKYSPDELRQRLVGVKEILASKSATALNAYVNPMGYYSNPFETGDYAAGGDLESQKQELRSQGYSEEQIDQLINS